AAVVRLGRADIEEIMDLRNALEMMALRRLARSATPAQLAELEESVGLMQGCHDPARLAELDLLFHESLVRSAGNQRLLVCWRTLLPPLKLLMISHNLRDRRSPQGTQKHHRELIALIRAGDGDGAAAHLERGHAVHRLQALAAAPEVSEE